jgi:oxygen-independent coproporphyrinogen-3 oxidase
MRSATEPARSSFLSEPASREPAAAADGGFGVYVHWPFCASKCPYCDFNSHVRASGIDEPRFLAAFLREMAYARELTGPRRAVSVFFGGGTPSLMQPATVGRLIEEIDRLWPLDAGAEITLEANPGSVEAARFRGYHAAGVNRVSLGVQSLREADLKALGRVHTVAEAKAAIAIAQATFERSSFDLIYARPAQTEAAWQDELGEALALAHGHLSLYQLTIEQGTPFAALHSAGKLRIPDPERADALYEVTQSMTAAAGLPAYEISNHARAGEESRHNLVYWRYGTYAGIGPGAHGRLGHDGQRVATATERHPERWLQAVEREGHGLVERAFLSPAEQADEALLMGLRLREGIDLSRLVYLGGVRPADHVIDSLADLGVIERIGSDRIVATPRGRFVLNELVVQLSRSFRPAP